MDLSNAYRWHITAGVPLGIAMAFWFMSEELTDERIRTWLLNLYRFASEGDCQRTIKGLADKSKMIAKTMYAQISSRNQAGTGVIDFFAEDHIFTNVDNFWEEYPISVHELYSRTSMHDSKGQPSIGKCRTTHRGTEPEHIIYSNTFRSIEWYTFMKSYWNVYELEECVPPFNHVTFMIERILQSARDLTLAIRLKNDLVATEGERINEVILVRKIL